MGPFRYIVTGREMTQYDHNTIEELGVPALVLMEQAALAVAEEIAARFPKGEKRVLVLVGSGNNGGDGMAVARLLIQRKFSVTIFLVGKKSPERAGETVACQYRMLQKMQAKMVTELPEDAYDIVVDGIFGVGLNRPVEEPIGRILERVSNWKAWKVAIDIPSGIDSNTGKIWGYGFRADYTITFAFMKLGLLAYPGAKYAGKVHVKPMGITENAFGNHLPTWISLTGEGWEYMPNRAEEGHKGSFGKVLVIAGNKQTGGAAYLAALAAFRTGCGMVCIFTHRNQHSALTSLLPEAIFCCYESSKEARERLEEWMEWADVILLGPALGKEKMAKALLQKVILDSKKPLVIDADGLNLLADSEWGEQLKGLQQSELSKRPLIFTPHPGELSRLAGCLAQEDILERSNLLGKLAKEWQGVIVGKDARTLVVDFQGKNCINCAGNSGMATAGSGDFLAGMITALLAQGMKPFWAASCGVYLHAKAGDWMAGQNNEYSLMASDLAEGLKWILRRESKEKAR